MTTLTGKVLPAADIVYKMGEVLVYGGKEKGSIWSIISVDVTERIIRIQLHEGISRQKFIVIQIKP